MRGVLVTLTSWTSCLALLCSSLMLPTEAHASNAMAEAALLMAPAAGQGVASEDPRALYEEGRKAYRLGDFEAAVDKWERAYDLSDKPLLLYNISLAYKGRYSISRDIADLRRSKAILDNFIKIAEADPDLDLDDAPERMAELEKLIAKAEEEEASGAEPTRSPESSASGTEQLRDMPEGPDPGRKLRIAGIASMGGGGALVLIGAGVGIYFLIRSQQETTKLRQANEDLKNCPEQDTILPPPSTPDDQVACYNAYSRADTARANGQYANRVGYISVGVLGGIGLVGLIAGAVMFTEGNRRSRRWEQGIASRIRVMPTTRGLLVQGRF
jgi:tetratricopeptide (TPR) repeat protein